MQSASTKHDIAAHFQTSCSAPGLHSQSLVSGNFNQRKTLTNGYSLEQKRNSSFNPKITATNCSLKTPLQYPVVDLMGGDLNDQPSSPFETLTCSLVACTDQKEVSSRASWKSSALLLPVPPVSSSAYLSSPPSQVRVANWNFLRGHVPLGNLVTAGFDFSQVPWTQ